MCTEFQVCVFFRCARKTSYRPIDPQTYIFTSENMNILNRLLGSSGFRWKPTGDLFINCRLPVCSVACFCWKSKGLREIYLLLQFLRYRHAVCSILLTTKMSTNCWNRFLNFCLKNFLRLFKVKNFFKIFFWVWKAVKQFRNKNSKICFLQLVGN